MKKFKNKKQQNGVALAIGIILLLVISVIGVTSMKSALLQEKMSGGLARKGLTSTAAYTLLVAVENYLFNLYKTNNGIENSNCGYCSGLSRGDDWYHFIREKDMSVGATYPGSTSLITSLAGNLHDEPRFVVYPIIADIFETNSGDEIGATVGEEGGASAAGSSGSLGNSNQEPNMNYYKVATKANDSTGNIYVVYESIFATRQN